VRIWDLEFGIVDFILAENRRGTALQQLGKRFAYAYYGEIPQTIRKKMTERSDILKSSIVNIQYSIPACPG
jgi:hypothetical protein